MFNNHCAIFAKRWTLKDVLSVGWVGRDFLSYNRLIPYFHTHIDAVIIGNVDYDSAYAKSCSKHKCMSYLTWIGKHKIPSKVSVMRTMIKECLDNSNNVSINY